ncbi:MAG: energy-coupling factor transporter transmembrane protein EcfT [Propionibacteriaceae bacterium]|nr:energy-coupling factor transporter transmembrane protein EcfT [Propionibacteriaceae bacterium]
MNGVFSLYVPGDSLFHRCRVGWKYLLMIGATFTGVLAQNVFVSLGLLVGVLACLGFCGLGLSYTWRLPGGIWATAGLLICYQSILGKPLTGVMIATNLVMALYAARILTMTTPAPILIDSLVSAFGWTRIIGLKPARIGLAITLMFRSLPALLDSFRQVREAAKARGRQRNLVALVTPFVVRTVGYAQQTGEALAARGLGDE